MSPFPAMERGYAAIKHMLRNGQVASGARLEAHVLAQDLGVSVTPVRDALHRLAGERLVETMHGGGFRVPRYSEANLRYLYAWNATLMIWSARALDISPALRTRDAEPLAQRFGGIIDRIAMLELSPEIAVALLNASDRLQPFRIAETIVFDDLEVELDGFQMSPDIVRATRLLHKRRIRAVADLLRQRDRA